ncbi:MAG TPA: M1 family aminopeptidase, partial [Myxococcota bacterium]|nr:M1 family aminopeptidase [Myxococcota bacterium]
WQGFRAASTWDPNLRLDLDFLASVQGAMREDSLAAARAIHQPCDNAHDIANAFDAITYSKGGGVLRMFESYLGPERFQQGIQAHLRRYQFASATGAEFLQSLEKETGDPHLAAAFESFLDKPGVPEVRAELDCSGGAVALKLSQSRYRPLGSAVRAAGQWQVPVCWRYAVPNGGLTRGCTLLTEPTQTVAPTAPACPTWLIPNAEGAGYYRWRMDATATAVLATAPLSVRERMSLADNVIAAFEAGTQGIGDVLRALAPLAAAPERQISTAPFEVYRFVHDELLAAEAQGRARAWYGKLYAPQAARLGLSPKAGESSEEALGRRIVQGFFAQVVEDPQVRQGLTKLG